MPAPRKVTAEEKAEIKRAVRAREGADVTIVISDETDENGQIPVRVVRDTKRFGVFGRPDQTY